MTAKFFSRSSVRIANVRRQPREDNTVQVWDAPIIRNQDAPDDVLLLADLAEAACGSVLQTSGQTEILKLLPPDQVRATRKKIAAKFGRQSSGLTPVERLLKWSVSGPRRRMTALDIVVRESKVKRILARNEVDRGGRRHRVAARQSNVEMSTIRLES